MKYNYWVNSLYSGLLDEFFMEFAKYRFFQLAWKLSLLNFSVLLLSKAMVFLHKSIPNVIKWITFNFIVFKKDLISKMTNFLRNISCIRHFDYESKGIVMHNITTQTFLILDTFFSYICYLEFNSSKWYFDLFSRNSI